MERSDRIERARSAVVNAAVAWVNFEDTGTVIALHEETRIRQKLAGAVTRLERAQRRTRNVSATTGRKNATDAP